MNAEAKPWYQSETIRGGIIAALTGLAGLIDSAIRMMNGEAPSPEVLAAAIMALGGGIAAINGRVKATQPIAPLRGKP
jgi:hypothetical protein